MRKSKEELHIKKQITNLHKLNAQYRGEIINHAINTETHLEMIISFYFTNGNKQKEKELRHCLLSNTVNFYNKKNMFLFIKNNSFPKCQITSEDLEQIMNLRNQMAHGKQLFFSDKMDEIINFDRDAITLLEWKTKNSSMVEKPIKLTRAFVKKEIKHIQSVNAKLIELFRIIRAEFTKQ